jgi:hypothetical protein
MGINCSSLLIVKMASLSNEASAICGLLSPIVMAFIPYFDCLLPFYKSRHNKRWLLEIWILAINRLQNGNCSNWIYNCSQKNTLVLIRQSSRAELDTVKDLFVFGYWKLVTLFSNTLSNMGWLKLILVISFLCFLKYWRWCFQNWTRTCSSLERNSFLTE